MDKADRCSASSRSYDFALGHEQTYEWFRAQGFGRLDGPLVDPVWRARWDFDAEAAAVAALR